MVHKKCAELTAHFFVIGGETRRSHCSAAVSPSPRDREGHTFDKSRGFTFFPEALRQIGGKIQKCDFGFFEKFLK